MKCDCGATKHGWTHSSWCSSFSNNFQIHKCEGHALGCTVSGASVYLESSRTHYIWDGTGEDPNRDLYLCRDCAKFHHEYWDEMWAEYYSGLL